VSLEKTFKSNFRLVLLHVNRVIVFGKLPVPAEHNPCTTVFCFFFFFFFAEAEWDYRFNFMYDHDIENHRQMCIVRSGDRLIQR